MAHRQLHIVVSPPDEFAQELIKALQAQPGAQVEVADWVAAEPDYAGTVSKIFEADSVVTW
ncbi:MAG TPA: hypothetical protein PLX89_00475 [Verrucomicrobiota bacterium]|nr:hypothetical protein [Verrucomicrobiales bacterium]HRI11451.1 hypothetical protein [Verrucomicrobiota bacterium]